MLEYALFLFFFSFSFYGHFLKKFFGESYILLKSSFNPSSLIVVNIKII